MCNRYNIIKRSGYPAGTGIRKSCVRKPVRYYSVKLTRLELDASGKKERRVEIITP